METIYNTLLRQVINREFTANYFPPIVVLSYCITVLVSSTALLLLPTKGKSACLSGWGGSFGGLHSLLLLLLLPLLESVADGPFNGHNYSGKHLR